MRSPAPTKFVSLLDHHSRPSLSRRAKWLLVAGAVLLAGGAGGGYYLYRRSLDPAARAEQLTEQGDLRGAMVQQRNVLRDEPRSAEAHVRMGRLQAKLADAIGAEREFRTAIALGADRAALTPDLGDALLAQGKFTDVIAAVPARGPTPQITAKNLLLRAVAFLSMDNLSRARSTLAEAQATVPGTVETALIGARIAAANNDPALLEKRLAEALAIDPAQTEALVMQEKLLASRGDLAGALAFSDRAVKSAPWSAMARIDRATQLLAADKDALAQADVTAVLASQPRFADAIYLNGILLSRAGKFPEAAIELGKLQGAVQRFPLALYYQAVAASKIGQTEVALDFAQRYHALAPAAADGVRLLARAELAARRPGEAQAVLEHSVANGLSDAETMDLLGQVYAALNNTQAAYLSFSKAATQAPDDPAILTHLGVAQVQQGEAARGTSTLKRVLALDPASRLGSTAVAAAAIDTGDFAQAEAALARLRSEEGETERVAWLAASIQLRRGDLDAAQQSFTAMLRTFPGSIDGQLGLANVMLAQDRRDAAMGIIGNILAKSPANRDVLDAYVPLLLQSGQVATIVAVMEAAHRADPGEPRFAAMLSDSYLAAGTPKAALQVLEGMRVDGKMPNPLLDAYGRAQDANDDKPAAKAAFREAIAAEPADFLARSALLNILLAERDSDGAKALLRETLAVAPGNFRVMWIMVNLEAATNGFDNAVKLAAALRDTAANMPFAQVLKGDLYVRAGRPAEAVDAFAAEYKLAPSGVLARRIAATLSGLNRDDEAAQRLHGWLRDHPDSPDELGMLSQLDIKAKRYDDAKTHLSAVLALRPDEPRALNNLAWVYFATGDARARETAQQAYLRAPTAAAGDTLGWILAEQGASTAAIPLLQRASAQTPDDPAIKYHLAAALQRGGQPEDARAVLEPLLATPAAFEDRPAAERLMQSLPPHRP